MYWWKNLKFWRIVALSVLCLIVALFFLIHQSIYIRIATPFSILLFIALILSLLLRFYRVKEGFCMAKMRQESFEEFIMRWRGKGFDSNWEIGEDAEYKKPFWGGLVWMWFFEKPHEYYLSWKTPKEGDEEPVVHDKEKLVMVLLEDKTYYLLVSKAEDLKLMPLRLVVLITLRVVNPYKAIFEVDDWLQVVLAKIAPVIRAVVAEGEYKKLTLMKDNIGRQVIEGNTKERVDAIAKKISYLEEQLEVTEDEAKKVSLLNHIVMLESHQNKSGKDVIDAIRKEYGVWVKSVEVRDVDPESEEDREATLVPVREEYKAEGLKAKTEGEALKTAIEAKATAAKTLTLLEADVLKVTKTAEADAKKLELIAEATKKQNVLMFSDTHKEVVNMMIKKGIPVEEANKIAEKYITTYMEVEKGAKKHLVVDINGENVGGTEKAIIGAGSVLLQQFMEVAENLKSATRPSNKAEEAEKKIQQQGETPSMDGEKIIQDQKQTEQPQKIRNVGGIQIPESQVLEGLTKDESEKKMTELYKKRRSS